MGVHHIPPPPQELYCDSITCDGGYAPIKNAEKVECDDGKCDKNQCCDKLCSCYTCPDNYSSVEGYDIIVCEDSGCTKDLCCAYVGETPPNKKK